MKFLKKILYNVGRTWDNLPWETPALIISPGTGRHTMVTLEGNYLHLHSVSFRSDLPVKQTVNIENLSVAELAVTLTSMGYGATVSASEVSGIRNLKAICLVPVKNSKITCNITAFTSPTWQLLYPIHRLLMQVDYDIDEAIRQMYLTTTRGSWVDYWGTYFNVRRKLGEVDEELIKRIYVKVFRTKTNNVAIKEALKFHTNTDTEVYDYDPARFRVVSDPDKFINNIDYMHSIIMETKGAGIDYFVDFIKTRSEDYKGTVADKTGKPYKNTDSFKGTIQFTGLEDTTENRADDLTSMAIESVMYEFYLMGAREFTTNVDDLNSDFLLNQYQEPDDLYLELDWAFSEAMRAPVEGNTWFNMADSEVYGQGTYEGQYEFVLNVSDTNSIARLANPNIRIFEGLAMKMTQAGKVVQQI